MANVETLNEILDKTAYIALATSKDNKANVRVMTIWYNLENKGVIYFPTVKTAPKTEEFNQNSEVAITTIANFQNGVLRIKSATVKKSELTVEDIKDGIAKNDPIFANTIQRLGKEVFDVYEAHFDKAYITVGADENIEIIL